MVVRAKQAVIETVGDGLSMLALITCEILIGVHKFSVGNEDTEGNFLRDTGGFRSHRHSSPSPPSLPPHPLLTANTFGDDHHVRATADAT